MCPFVTFAAESQPCGRVTMVVAMVVVEVVAVVAFVGTNAGVQWQYIGNAFDGRMGVLKGLLGVKIMVMLHERDVLGLVFADAALD